MTTNECREPEPGAETRVSPLAWLLIAVIKIYQGLISPLLPPSCRFYPSCSAYAVEALHVHGVVRGTALSAWRLLRCGPWHPGGVDPVPPRRARRPDRAGGPRGGGADRPEGANRPDDPARRAGQTTEPEERAPC